MKKLKTNIRYFMQLRQSPSMVLRLEKKQGSSVSPLGDPTHGGGISAASLPLHCVGEVGG